MNSKKRLFYIVIISISFISGLIVGFRSEKSNPLTYNTQQINDLISHTTSLTDIIAGQLEFEQSISKGN